MSEKSLVRIGATAIFALLLVPETSLASSLTVTTVTPTRPQIHLTPSLRMDVRPHDVSGPDLSETCPPNQRLKHGKRERRCRQNP